MGITLPLSLRVGRCPFCGSADLQLIDGIYENGFYVACMSCEAQGPPAETEQLALERWTHKFDEVEMFGYNFQKVTDYLT